MDATHIVDAGTSFPIQPDSIDASQHLFGSFDNMETEASAGWIIRFLQERKQGWAPFTFEDINGFYARKHSHKFRFNRLVEPEMVPPSLARAFAGHHDPRIPVGGGWIILRDGTYYLTPEFINRCHRSSPTKQQTSVST